VLITQTPVPVHASLQPVKLDSRSASR
jgi:hypothetical protein